MTNVAALIVAAGRGHRFGGELPKQYADLAGAPVLRHTIAGFASHTDIDTVSVVIHPDDYPLYAAAAAGFELAAPVDGGATRQLSVRAGLEALTGDLPNQRPDYVLIHDAARPLVDADTISRIVAALGSSAGAIAALPVVDTIARVQDGSIAGPVDRTDLWAAQTPQGFHFDVILAAHRAAGDTQDLTDDASVARAAGVNVAVVAGTAENFKITTGTDLSRAAALLGSGTTRVGMGYDVHKFSGNGDAVILCGVKIEHNSALAGHSDADVALHAITDAVLGAIGAGDIGDHFPPSDDRWAGAPSDLFLTHAIDLVGTKNGRVVHLDLTLICEAPKIGPHRRAMVENLARIAGLDATQVSVKATTTEGLGFTGRGEGIAAQAVATLVLP